MMVITLTDAALKKLKNIGINEDNAPRIDADLAGGCGISVKFALIFDEPRRNDTVIEQEGIQLRIDRFTKRYLEEETQIDYTDDQGFLVGESFESSACAIEIE
ncbi:iron-sulfur cluster biosynthesis family protein [Evansella sp. LMS18]|uniref:iron-sulfur cluster biosynthesis family protein n=1 Tax=Evansella sp. LMS18 TaxID=2924033 RepID=UPI0020D09BC6|nr:iron-sulfur cluster biosynthesis family protein [Evansella sp. LMS18]UTR08776.1 iron-sulfur cluster biosynthesis family protein [Evansella sp. LMS18]